MPKPKNPTRQPGPGLFDAVAPAAPDEVRHGQPLLLVLDGHAMAYRAYFALARSRPMTLRATGEDVRAVYSFTATLLKALADLKPTHVIVAFDPPGPTFRHEDFEAYKAHRPSMPADLPAQVDYIKRVMQALHVPIMELPGYEADDVLGALARQATGVGVDTVICTGDTDTLQLVGPRVRVRLTTGFGDQKDYDEQAVREKYGGLEPHQQRDMKALKGDATDNVPGVPGIGEVSATKLIRQFGSLEALYERLDEVQPPRLQALLREHEAQARQGKRLVTIATDAPVTLDLARARFGQYSREEVLQTFRELEFNSLVPRIPPANGSQGAPPAIHSSQAAQEPREAPAAGPTAVTIVETEAQLGALVQALGGAAEFAFDTEADQLDPMRANLVGLSFAVVPGEAYYVPVGHAAGAQLPLETVLSPLRDLLMDGRIGKVGHNLNYDMTLLTNYGVRPARVRVACDTMLAAHLLGEKALGLKALAFTRLKVELPPITALIGTGRKQITFDQVPIQEAAPYAASDADMTLRLAHLFRAELEAQGLWDLLVSREMPLVPVLVQMQAHGIAVDPRVLAQLGDELTGQIQSLEGRIYDGVGHHFMINSPGQLSDILFNELKLPHGKRTQTGFSTDADTLQGFSRLPPEAFKDTKPQALEVVTGILAYRELTKLKSTYVDTLPAQINPRTGRIHTSYNQAGAATGRIASNDPNLQNIPVRTELGRRVRKAFIAERRPAWMLLAADYSQIELRVLAHLSRDPALIAAFARNEDIHTSTAALVYKVPLSDVTKDMRRIAKVMNFGVIYGLSAFGIAQQTELTQEEGAKFIETYFGTYPRVKQYLDEVIWKARTDGYVETLLGRRRYVPEVNASNYQLRQATERMVVNMPVQGTAAEIIKAAMIEVQQRLEERAMAAKMLLQVHDELIFELPRPEEADLRALLQDVMPTALSLVVPLRIDIKTGDTWGDLE